MNGQLRWQQVGACAGERWAFEWLTTASRCSRSPGVRLPGCPPPGIAGNRVRRRTQDPTCCRVVERPPPFEAGLFIRRDDTLSIFPFFRRGNSTLHRRESGSGGVLRSRHEKPGPARSVRVHRRLLQSPSHSLATGLHQTHRGRIQSRLTPSMLRKIRYSNEGGSLSCSGAGAPGRSVAIPTIWS